MAFSAAWDRVGGLVTLRCVAADGGRYRGPRVKARSHLITQTLHPIPVGRRTGETEKDRRDIKRNKEGSEGPERREGIVDGG